MANLKEIEEILNKDPEEAKKFQADPVGYLESKGVTLPDAAKKQLTDKVQGKGEPGHVWNVGIMLGPKS